MSRTKEAMIENGDFKEVEDDGDITLYFSQPQEYSEPPKPEEPAQ